MSVANLQETLLLYKSEESALTYKLNLVMADKTMASKNTSELATETLNNKAVYEAKAEKSSSYANSTQYQADLQNVENDYELKLADINSWESELDQQSNNFQTQIKELQEYEENCTTELKSNVKSDFTYGGGGGGASAS